MTIDIHSHILPCADHGSTSVEMSLRQLKRAKDAGIDVIVATPHFYLGDDSVDSFLERRENAYADLKKALDADKELVNAFTIKLGAEVALRVGLTDLPDLKKLCIEDTDYMLLEMPMAAWTNWEFEAIYKIKAFYHIKPIIAHIDRYPSKNVRKLLSMDVDAQINASPLVSFSRRKEILKYVKSGYVCSLGSDVHLDEPMYKHYEKALKILGDNEESIMERSANILGLKNK